MTSPVATPPPDNCFDLQINGYGGIDFNRPGLTVDDCLDVCRRLRGDGCSEFLATIITDDVQQMSARIRAIVMAISESAEVAASIRGIHVEGPFLNSSDGTAGAHPRQHIRPACVDSMKRLLEASDGTLRLVTLAPECDPGFAVTQLLAEQGVIVSAGHCDPTIDQLEAAIDHGLSMFTHVGNGCSLLQDRHNNIVQRVLSLAPRLWCCWIADGIHVPPFALRNYLKVAGVERSIVVTDAMTAAGLGPGEYTLGTQKVFVDERHRAMLPGSDGRLAGSVATPRWLVQVLKRDVGLSEEHIQTMMCVNPRRALGL